MTGASELRNAEAVSAAPEAIRVSVLGGRTQLDVALPADVPVAAFVPDLARLIGSRDYRHGDDVTDHDERRTFWVLCHVDTDTDTDTELAPDETLRSAGIANGELLRMTARRALSPPTLYDDVVDAAARLNRAAYAAWDATAAGVMAFAGLWLCAAVWVYFLMADALSAHRSVVVIGAALTAVTMVAGAGLVHRGLGRTEIATAFAAPTLALSAALGWVAAEPLGAYGLAAAGLSLLMLTAVYYRIVGTGHQFYIATAMLFAFGGLALLGRATGARADVVATLAATSATLGCLAVQPLTARLARLPASTALPAAPPHDRPFDNPFSAAGDAESQAAMPTAEEVWARVRSVALTRAGLLAGLATVAAAAVAMVLHAVIGWASLTFALVSAAVLALRARRAPTVAERAALAVPATALVLIACVQAQSGAGPLRLAGVGVLVAVLVAATLAGLVVAGGHLPGWVSATAAYLEYVAVAALIPVALSVPGVYHRMGLW